MAAVLVIDDSGMMRKIVLRTLKLAEIDFETVHEAGDGLEALDVLRQHEVDLVMCDINMPNMNGLEFLTQLKQEGLAADTPIVMVTTEGSEPQIRQALLSGAKGYIRKPFTLDHIKASVRPLLTF